MIYSLCAIALLMVVGWAFGIACDRLLIRWSKSHLDTSEDGSADHDRWEDDPEPTELEHVCDTCKYNEFNEWYEPCLHCGKNYEKWEKA